MKRGSKICLKITNCASVLEFKLLFFFNYRVMLVGVR